MAWYDEAIFYHIYPLGLLGAPKQNTYEKAEHRLKELKKWIKHVKNIGCNAIYIGPLFESVGHGYETTDYRKLDSRLGDNSDLKKFVEDCHKAGIRVIFDGVFNHVGRDFFAFKDLKENRENSRYRDWFCNVNFGGNNEYNDGFSYDNWGGYNLLVKLNQRNPEVKNYICDVIRFWVSEFDVDGLRLDAADVLDFDFMKDLRRLANEVKPDFWLMGEVIHGDYSRWVNGETLHSVTDYALHKALFSGHNDHNYFEIAHTIRRINDLGGNRAGGLKLYNFTDNHDVERIINKLNNRANYIPVHVLEYTLPGVPSIYYGSEFGIEGKKEKYSDDSIRPRINIDDYASAYTDNPYTVLISRLGRIRQEASVLSYGNYEEKMLTNRQFAFTRNTDSSTAIIAVNNDENTAEVYAGGIRDGEYVGAISGRTVTVSGGNFRTTIDANSGEIFLMQGDVGEMKPMKAKKPAENPKENCADVKATVSGEQVTESAESDSLNCGTIASCKQTVESAMTGSENSGGTDKKENQSERADIQADKTKAATYISAKAKYSLEDKYAAYDVEAIDNRRDYENMCIEELQVAILEKMAHNGPVNEQMIKTVMDNVYHDSLINWVKSFR